MADQSIDYDALAKKHGAVSSGVDYDALAKAHGSLATPDINATPKYGNTTYRVAPHSATDELPGATGRLRLARGLPQMPPPPPNIGEKISEFLPAVGGMIGGLAGNVPGAVAGGMTGKAAELGVKELVKDDQLPGGSLRLKAQAPDIPMPPAIGNPARPVPLDTNAADLAWEGLKQGAYEATGRAIPAAIMAMRTSPEVVGTTIKGTTLPETWGQSSGATGGFTQTLEHYLSGTFLGGPLKAVREAQQEASRRIMAKLSLVPDAAPAELSKNWAKAREITRGMASPMYESFGDVQAPEIGKVAGDILGDDSLKLALNPRSRQALQQARTGALSPEAEQAMNTMNDTARGMGYRDMSEAMQVTNGKFAQWVPKDLQDAMAQSAPTVRDAIQARSALRDVASSASDRNVRRMALDATEKMDTAIDAALTPEQRAVKEEADKLWHRSYIMDRMQKSLAKMEGRQDPNAAPKIITSSFVKTVNDLAREGVGRDAEGAVVSRPSELSYLFDNPADQKALKDLASFLSTKGSTLNGASGIGESVAKIGTVLEATHIPVALATGHPVVAAGAGAQLAGMYAASKILANPGGAKLLYTYFRSSPATQVALATKLAAMTQERTASQPPSLDSGVVHRLLPLTTSTQQPPPTLRP